MTFLISAALVLASAQATAPLRIVVIEGEGAVNIIQQKTAVSPLVEVRDRNNQPVSGAIVNFVIRNGRATFGGARAISVTTNAAGRAVATGFAPSGSGALQIGATATFQGQTAAAVTIAQTNVMTAAEAAAATASASTAGGSGGGGGAAGGGAGAGGGGGVSATTLGIVGGAVAAGAVVAKETLSSSSGTNFTGQFSAIMPETEVATQPGQNYSCARSQNQNGTLKITFDTLDGPVQGTMETQIHAEVSRGNCNHDPYSTELAPARGSVSGPRENITGAIHNQSTFTTTTNVAGTGVVTEEYRFTGQFDDENQITGTLTLDRTVVFTGPLYSADSHGAVTFQVTLRRQ